MASRFQRRALLGLSFGLLLGACGYVGDPLPPALYIPLPVVDLRAMQQGDAVAVEFTLPARSTEDSPLDEIPEVDLRAAEWDSRPWDEGAWEREATRLTTLPAENGRVAARVAAGPWVGKRMLIRVRVAGKLGRFSAWSEPIALRVIEPGGSIRGFGVTSAPEGARLFWSAAANRVPGMVTEIFRRDAEAKEFARLAAVEKSEWVDRGAAFGSTYAYRVRTRVEGEERNYAGAFVEPQTITPVDTFAPAPPGDVAIVAGASGAELSWTRNLEADFLEYRVYRSVAGGEFSRVGEATGTPVFSDASAPRGVALRYRITSVDGAGNESEPCPAVEITLP